MTVNTQDSATWLPLSGLEPGFNENKATSVPTDHVDGTTLTTRNDAGTTIRHVFRNGLLEWDIQDGQQSGVDAYEAFMVDDGLLYVQVHHRDIPDEAVAIIFDLRAGTCLSVLNCAGRTPQGSEPGHTGVSQSFIPSIIVEHEGERGPLPHPTNALIGRRVRWEYSESHTYEHVYINSEWYTWHCISGPERGQADTDLCTYYEIRKGIYVFAWREKVIPCASVTVADHRDVSNIRSWGMLFGPDDRKEGYIHFTFGAKGHLTSINSY
ncbi:MoaF C-terminal domain-containing protein [Bifidobacterium aquikefiricola]|uniref:MoaF C-terminal domain-containing protein n=1 Tax=Bifidobacterium aquikefiricola TaxID=3059038 RepID=A0AB39U914_9BIFI